MSTQWWLVVLALLHQCAWKSRSNNSFRVLAMRRPPLERTKKSLLATFLGAGFCRVLLTWEAEPGLVHAPACGCMDTPVLAPVLELSTHLLLSKYWRDLEIWSDILTWLKICSSWWKSTPKLESTASISGNTYLLGCHISNISPRVFFLWFHHGAEINPQ